MLSGRMPFFLSLKRPFANLQVFTNALTDKFPGGNSNSKTLSNFYDGIVTFEKRKQDFNVLKKKPRMGAFQ